MLCSSLAPDKYERSDKGLPKTGRLKESVMSALGNNLGSSRASAAIETSEMDTPQPSGLNALKHGVYSKARLLPWEDSQARKDLDTAYMRHFDPKDALTEDMVATLADITWRMRRIDAAEEAIARYEIAKSTTLALPMELRQFADELVDQETELAILKKILARMESQSRKRRPCLECLPLLSIITPFEATVHDMDLRMLRNKVGELIGLFQQQLDASRKSLEQAKKDRQLLIDAAAHQAALLPPDVQARLSRERVRMENTFRKTLDALERIQKIPKARSSLNGKKTGLIKTKPSPGNLPGARKKRIVT